MAPNIDNDNNGGEPPQVGHPEHVNLPDAESKGNTPLLSGIISSEDEVRTTVGEKVNTFTDVVNNNLVAARFAAVSGVVLLTAYGLSQTPLFFRFRTVAEIPASYFSNRRRLYGRIISVNATTDTNQSIELSIRHLSPVGQILPKQWFDFFMKFSPLAARLAKTRQKYTAEESKSELLRVKIAGIQSPPVSRQSYQPEQFLERLAKDRTLVSCQLLARQVPDKNPESSSSDARKQRMSDILPDLKQDTKPAQDEYSTSQQVAICKLSYRPTLFQLFPNDIAQSLISTGNASVAPSMFGDATARSVTTVDSSQRIQDLRYDVKYLDRLAKAEFEAARKSMGMWSVPEVREMKREVIEEIDFQKKANIFQKVWRWFRG